MRIFFYEYTCARGLTDSALRTEGEAMLNALSADFHTLPGVEAFTLRDAADEEAAFRAAVRTADATLVIAPESEDILSTRCRWVAEEGGRWLGSSAEAIRLSGDKFALSEQLRGAGVPTPMSWRWRLDLLFHALPMPAVLKPRFGAGSQATFIVKQTTAIKSFMQQARDEGWTGELMLQAFVPGQAASVAYLVGPCQRLPLLPAEQHLSDEGRFHYLGGSLPLSPDRADRAQRLADRAIAAVPGLAGYVGVDLILGDAADGSADVVIEINPRLTTSYIGLRALAAHNLVATMLAVLAGEPLAPPAWRSGRVQFRADGWIQ